MNKRMYMDTILNGLQEENFDVDPFLTNLARGIIAAEGTIKTLSPKVNIPNAFMTKVDIGFDLDLENLDKEHLKDMNPEIALKLLQLAKGITDSSTKTAEALDMLEKGQIRVRTDFSFEEKALATITRLTGYAVRALIIIALIIGSSLLCTSSSFAGDHVAAVTIIFRGIGFVGLFISLFFAQRLFRDMKNGKQPGPDSGNKSPFSKNGLLLCAGPVSVCPGRKACCERQRIFVICIGKKGAVTTCWI